MSPSDDAIRDHAPASRMDDASSDYTPPEKPKAKSRQESTVRRGGVSVLSSMIVIVVGLALVRLSVGPIAEEIQYGITRGRERAQVQGAKEQLARLSETSEAFRLVAQSIGPSVVHIEVKMDEVKIDDESTETPGGGEHESLSAGQGSGVIVDEDGFILTNYHVIHGADQIDVHLSDGRTCKDARVVGFDPATDLAVLQVEGVGLTPASWGDSDALNVGDWVLAVGNPFGLDRSVTAGIVSGTQRRKVVPQLRYQDFIQTDAAVNPGNSGGPLVNLRGEVIGINTAIVGKAFRGISFAIPSRIARATFEGLKENGSVSRGWLGVRLVSVRQSEADSLGVKQGARVVRVMGVPARTAGLTDGDVIVAWNGEEVSDSTDLSLKVARTPVDTVAEVVVVRDGQRQSLDIKVGRQPPEHAK